jgi:hypothetical protein
MTEQKLCTVCGAVGTTKRNMKGSLLTELLLWCFFLLPGLIYSIWRHSTIAQVCRICGSPAVIHMASPVARQVLANRGSASEQVQAPTAHSPACAPSGGRPTPTGKITLAIVAGCSLIVIISLMINTGAPTNAARQNAPQLSTPPTAQARGPVAPKMTNQTRHTGNVAQDRLATFVDSEQAAFLGAAVEEGCAGTRAYFMGMDRENDAFWSIGCASGESYSVEILPDSTGSTRVLECSVLKAVAGMRCFTKFAK